MSERKDSAIRCFETAHGLPCWVLEMRDSAYVLGVDENGLIQHLYWGAKLGLDSDYGNPAAFPGRSDRPEGISNEEFLVWGGLSYTEHCLKASFKDGVRATSLLYDRAEIDNASVHPSLTIFFNDAHYELSVRLRYVVVSECNLVVRNTVLVNTGNNPIDLERTMSATWRFPLRDGYTLRTLNGEWSAEFQIQESPVVVGKQVIERRTGSRGHDAQPWFGLHLPGTSETSGELWFGALAYSGNFQLILERTANNQVSLTGGISDFDFGWRLGPGESFETPAFVGGHTTKGYEEASRSLHEYEIAHVLPSRFAREVRPVLYNSWYVTEFDVNVANQSDAADRAGQLGVELFVMDDGWFGRRNHDRAGLGDWYVNPEKFPEGLGPLIDHVKSLGMSFGLWVEPEMVNPDSDLYRAHPDWVYHFPNRTRSESRNQLVLNLSRRDVRDFVFDFMHRLLGEHDISFIKWDMNRPFSEPGWPDAPEGRDREIWVRHTEGVYSILTQLREAHPEVLFESCSGGGARVDLGIMSRTDQFWMSDNTDPVDQLFMTEGFTLAYAPLARMAWVTDAPYAGNRVPPLEFRFHAAMLGAFGLGGNLPSWSQEEMEQAAQLIDRYKAVRRTIQHGRFYRLLSPRAGQLSAFQFVNQDRRESVLFLFLLGSRYHTHRQWVNLRGLESEARYLVRDGDAPSEEVGGQALMVRGLFVEIEGDYVSRLICIERVPQ